MKKGNQEENSKILVVGTNHRRSPIALREKLAFTQSELKGALKEIVSTDAVVGAVIVSTCNRTEVYAQGRDFEKATAGIKRFLSFSRRLPLSAFESRLYCWEGKEALRHLFRVVSGLDSMLFGEPQVTGQVKAAYRLAKEEDCTDGLLDGIFQMSFIVNKEIRTQTGIGRMPTSLASVAVKMISRDLGSFREKTIGLIGAGKVSELLVKHLRAKGARNIIIVNRTLNRAKILAETMGAKAVALNELPSCLDTFDIVIGSIEVSDFVVRKADVLRIRKKYPRKPLFFVDLGVPRNFDPAIKTLKDVFLCDIDGLGEVVNCNLQFRLDEKKKAEKIIEKRLRKASRLFFS